MKKLLVSAIIFGFFSELVAYSQDENHWERYQCRTLREIVTIHRDSDIFRDMQSKKKAMLLTGDDFASQMKLTYLGKERPVSGATVVLLATWRKSFKEYAPPPDEFTTEFLFKEGSEEHWLVVQNALIDGLRKELKKGDLVNAYVIWIGAIRANANWEWLFGLNEFVPCPDAKQNCSL
jgi:hypothetical protein